LYDKVADNVYKSIVKGRLEQDDFVEDDGVDGYADNGMDDFGEPMQDSEDEKEINSTFLNQRVIQEVFLISTQGVRSLMREQRNQSQSHRLNQHPFLHIDRSSLK
jgi:hypothetical protein